MDILRISLLCLMTLFGYLRATASIEAKNNHLLSFNVKKVANAISKSECYCYQKPLQGKHVSEHISPNGEQQDRLVVFLYRNKNGQVTIYVPNKQKQRILPELTLDKGDQLKALHAENVIELYKLYSEAATLNHQANRPDWQKVFDGSSDIYFSPHRSIDIKTIQTYLPDIIFSTIHLNNNNLHINDKNYPNRGQPASSPAPKTLPNDNKHKNVNDFEIIYNPNESYPDLKPSAYEIIANLDQWPHKQNDQPKKGKEIHVTVNEFPRPADTLNQLNRTIITSNPKAIPEPKPTQATTIKDDTSKLVTTVPIIANIITNINTKRNQSVPSKVQVKPAQIYPSGQSQTIIQEDKYIYVIDGSTGKYVPISGKTDVLVEPQVIEEIWSEVPKQPSSLEYIPIPQSDWTYIDGEDFTPNENSAEKIFYISPGNIPAKFKLWFQEQIKVIERKRFSLFQAIDQEQFKILILQVLKRNGIILLDSGDFKDSTGYILYLSRLQLLLVLLGDPFKFDLINEKKCFTPYDLSYLKIIILNREHSPKILGIIPFKRILKKTYDITRLCDLGIPNEGCPGMKCPMENVKHNHIQIGNVAKTNNGNHLLGTFVNSRRNLNNKNDNDIRVENIQSLDLTKPTSKDIDVNEPLEKDDIDDYYDLLGLRIIGGNHATSSGTPVSSRA